MGLKNTNYKIGNNVYPNVYAVFNGSIKKLGNDYLVGFNIDTTREFALSDTPIIKKEVRISDWDRKTDIVSYAYQKSKEKLSRPVRNENGEWTTAEYDNVFTGWQDDKV